MKILRIRTVIHFVAVALMCTSAATAQEAQPTVVWDASSAGTAEFAAGVAIGADSRPVVADTRCAAFGTAGCQARAVKRNSDTGVVLWTYVDSAGGPSALDEAAGVAIGADGNPIMAFTECDSAGLNCLIVAVKLNGSNGNQLWRSASPAAVTSDFAKAISIGADGHAVVAGAVCTEPGNGACQGKVIKFNGTTGAIMWNVTRASTYQMLFGAAVIKDTVSQNNVIVTGVNCAATTQNCNFVTTQLNGANGTQVANTLFDSGEPLSYFSELAWGVAIGQDADPVVNGVSCLAGGCDFRAIKYSSIALGAPTTFNVTFNTGGEDATLGGGIAVGGDNRPVVVGASCTPAYPACYGQMGKVNTAGTLLWNATFTAAGATVSIQGVALGPDSNPVAVGYQCNGANCSSRTYKRLLQYSTAAGAGTQVPIGGDRLVADGARVTFTQVTTAGNTSLLTSNTGPTPPTGVTFIGSRYFTVQSTAVVTGTTTVCFNYSNILSGNENNYQVYRRNAANTAWVATTTTRDIANNYVCGASNPGLGLYAIGNQ